MKQKKGSTHERFAFPWVLLTDYERYMLLVVFIVNVVIVRHLLRTPQSPWQRVGDAQHPLALKTGI